MSQTNYQPQVRILSTIIIAALFGALLYGCGGGSSSGGGLSGPTDLTLDVQAVKTFHFTWPDASDETEYHLLENPDGGAGYTQVATIPANTTSYEHTVFLPERINASYILEKCVDGTCSQYLSTVNVSGTLTSGIGYVKASNTDTYDYFGQSVALSADGSTLAVGAYSAGTGGAVYVFSNSGGSWVQTGHCTASNAESIDAFGWSVALSPNGGTLAVGAIREDSDATGVNGSGTDPSASYDSGAVYIFSNNGVSWVQTDYIKALNTDTGDYFGTSVALSTDGGSHLILAVGAEHEDTTAADSGAVYLFSNSTGSWEQEALIKASNPGGGDYFGSSVVLSQNGTTLVVGAFQEDSNVTGTSGVGNEGDDPATADSGAVYVFSNSGGSWPQQAYIKASNTGAGDWFGLRIALSQDGNVLAVGAPYEDSNVTGVGVGDEGDDLATANSGAVYLFGYDSGSGWAQTDYIKASNTGLNDKFGIAVSLSTDGSLLAVGANTESGSATGINGADNDLANQSGAAYLLSKSTGSWVQQAYIKAINAGELDRFGGSVALSADGNVMAVGANNEDGSATGIGGDSSKTTTSDSGAVYLY
jgi:hypothetical protein